MALAAPEALIERACAAVSASDFGADGWREGLERLIAALARQPLTPQGTALIEGQIAHALASRLRVEDWLKRHPEDGASAIEGPVVIHGLPRTATSALLNFLANDSRWRFLRGWEALDPCPPPDIATEATDPRALKELERDQASSAVARSVHLQEAGGPVDDYNLLRLDFRNQEFGWPANEYTRWWRDCSMRTTYAYHARVLKLLQSHRPPNRWLVKAPWHNFHLDDLIGVYPNATLVMCHRDPAKLIPSVVSLLLITRSMVVPKDEIDPTELGQFVLEHLRVSIERVMDFRRRHGDDRFIDVFHEPFNADPERTAERVYARLGVELKPPVREAMAGWAERNRKGAYGEHRYAAEEFGLSEAAIRDTFADYMRHFDITPAASAA